MNYIVQCKYHIIITTITDVNILKVIFVDQNLFLIDQKAWPTNASIFLPSHIVLYVTLFQVEEGAISDPPSKGNSAPSPQNLFCPILR